MSASTWKVLNCFVCGICHVGLGCGRVLVTLLALSGWLGLVVAPVVSLFLPVCGRFLVTLLAVAGALGLVVAPLDSVFSPVCGRFLVTLLAVASTLGLAVEPL